MVDLDGINWYVIGRGYNMYLRGFVISPESILFVLSLLFVFRCFFGMCVWYEMGGVVCYIIPWTVYGCGSVGSYW